jgi:tetratricopeptide (TPR) repeat protein
VNDVPIKLTELPSRKPTQRQAADPVKPKDDEDRLNEAQKHIAAGVNRRALQVLDDVPEQNRGVRYWRVRAASMFSIASYRDAVDCYAKSLQLDNTHSDTWIRFATSLRLQSRDKNSDAILSACRAALKFDPNDARPYHIMGLTRMALPNSWDMISARSGGTRARGAC